MNNGAGRERGPSKDERSDIPAKTDKKPNVPHPPSAHEEDYEDGDIATPKPDHHGDDDEPL